MINEKQWMGIAVLAGLVSGMSVYAFDGRFGLIVFIGFASAMAGWVAYRRPDGSKPLLGLVVFGGVLFLSMPLSGLVLGGEVGNLWGLAAIMGLVPAAVFYLVVDRFIRK
ncbi:MAG: hypothetical protein HKN17_01235 [Rhodothermales bacterium]|nr:hypothetical protein [Rhodothermales bacterium]